MGRVTPTQAIAHNVCMNLSKVRYGRLAESAMSIYRVHHSSAATEKLMKSCAEVHLLALDDFSPPQISHQASGILFQIHEAHTGQTSVIVSPMGAQDLFAIVPNQVTADSLDNRILHPSTNVALQGDTNLREVHNPKDAIYHSGFRLSRDAGRATPGRTLSDGCNDTFRSRQTTF